MKSKLVILKSEIKRDLEKLESLLEKFDVSYQVYKQQKKYAFLVESAFKKPTRKTWENSFNLSMNC